MALKLTYDNPSFPKGTEFDLTGIGVVENGKTKTLTEEEEQAYLVRNGMTVREGTKDSETIKLEGTSEMKPGNEGSGT